MYISRPNYSISEITSQFKNKKDIPSVERGVSFCLFDILEDSDKFLISDLFPYYIEEFETDKTNEGTETSTGKSQLKPFNENISFEYFDKNIDKEVLINIIGLNHPLYLKLLTLLGKKESIKKEGYMIVYYFKSENEWGIPVETIIIEENDKKTIVQLFPTKSFSMNNSAFSDEQSDSLQGFISGLFNIFSNLIRIFTNKKIEYINLPAKNKQNKNTYLYKIPHIFLNLPVNNIKNNEALSMKIRTENKFFDNNIKILKNKLYFK